MNALKRHILYLLFAVSALVTARGQSDTTVWLVTFYPGSEVYELEGHTALRVQVPGADLGVSWGLFDFNAPNFVYRFVKGETDYMMGVIPWQYIRQEYIASGRRIVERRIDLDGSQKRRLLELLQTNALPENRTYRYNYVLDNCATRPLRMLELAAGDSIILGSAGDTLTAQNTFRKAMRHYHRNYPWYQLGIDLALGSGIDKPLGNRELSFAPATLDRQLDGATVNGRPLVSATVVSNDVDPGNGILPPTPWWLTPRTVFGAVFVLMLMLTVHDWRRRRPSRWADCLWFALTGLAGCLLTFLIFISTHYATSPNWLYLWLNPLGLVIAAAIWIKKAEKLVLWLQIANFAIVLTGLVLWPLTGQSTSAALILPVAVTLMRSGLYPGLALIKKADRRLSGKH